MQLDPRLFVRRHPAHALAIFAVFLVALGAPPAPAAGAEHYYRDNAYARTAPPDRALIEVPESAAMHGGYTRLTTDATGRVVRSAYLIDGKAVSESVYEYAGNARLPHRIDNYAQGAITGFSEITRNAAGEATRISYYAAQGQPTGYTTINWIADHAERANYTPDGTRRWHDEVYFSADGVEVRSVNFPEGANVHIESIFDPARGVVKSSKQFANSGALQVSMVNTYNSDDDRIRQDLYDPRGTWYGAEVYAHNLVTKKLYKFTSGESVETDINYDAKRWASSAVQYVNGKLVCRFQYEHLPDGTTKRTIAEGPDGSLWAEYPDHYVDEVDRNGHPPNSSFGVIHKAGNWW